MWLQAHVRRLDRFQNEFSLLISLATHFGRNKSSHHAKFFFPYFWSSNEKFELIKFTEKSLSSIDRIQINRWSWFYLHFFSWFNWIEKENGKKLLPLNPVYGICSWRTNCFVCWLYCSWFPMFVALFYHRVQILTNIRPFLTGLDFGTRFLIKDTHTRSLSLSLCGLAGLVVAIVVVVIVTSFALPIAH